MMSKCDLRLKKTPKRETKRASEARVVPPVDVPLSVMVVEWNGAACIP